MTKPRVQCLIIFTIATAMLVSACMGAPASEDKKSHHSHHRHGHHHHRHHDGKHHTFDCPDPKTIKEYPVGQWSSNSVYASCHSGISFEGYTMSIPNPQSAVLVGVQIVTNPGIANAYCFYNFEGTNLLLTSDSYIGNVTFAHFKGDTCVPTSDNCELKAKFKKSSCKSKPDGKESES
eukprot:Nk52_evm12s2011 gene=Nk52_evmTU12s2011